MGELFNVPMIHHMLIEDKIKIKLQMKAGFKAFLLSNICIKIKNKIKFLKSLKNKIKF